ncbi:lecithin retinol acyltransferase family protein [uncultured Selenomonas sp.]|uniref:lecithin retinol acyltransferase family protein n=1 Tax=uncultured Selenomonas sp. TaxID=159275 RepID=UPI002582D8EA|nr:lecithin retinol acyltransferase family protein [uncultured Selenomonas sp.]
MDFITKAIERLAKKKVKPIGDLMEIVDNTIDSIGNVYASTDVVGRIWHAVTDDTVDDAREKYGKGDHIVAYRMLYSHHGIYDGHGGVYEYQDCKIVHRSLKVFADRDDLFVDNEYSPYSPDEIIRRARSRLGEEDYNLIWNNCENFATWCRSGEEI